MICPVCGCQQREADRCIQCYTTLTPGEESGEDSNVSLEDRSMAPLSKGGASKGALSRPVEIKKNRQNRASDTQIKPRKKVVKAETTPKGHSPVYEKKQAPSGVIPSKPFRKVPARQTETSRQAIRGGRTHKILVTTTQRIEGKQITNYFGLISADIIVELGGASSSGVEQGGKSVNAHYRGELKKGMLTVLRDLRGEATLLGANAVIATSFNFQKMDLQLLLVSAVGTAVYMEDRT